MGSLFRSRSLGRPFELLWAAYAVSTLGTFLAFDAFALVAILALDAGPAQVSLLAAAGRLVGAALALPLGPWVELRRKRPVMVATDLVRCAALLTVPLAYALGRLTFVQLLVVTVIAGAADIAFKAASGAFLKSLLRGDDLLAANGRLESATWTATALGPPLGGALIGLLGPVVTVIVNAVSFALSAVGIGAIGGGEEGSAARPGEPDRLETRLGGRRARRRARRALRTADVLDGWRHVLGHPTLRRLFLNTVVVNGLIMATAPVMAVLMLRDLGFAPWQYGLAFGLPCVGGLIGSRLSLPLAVRFGQRRVLLVSGAVRACWPIGLAFVGSGGGGLALVIALQLGLVTGIGVFNPLFATCRLEQTPPELVVRTLSAWSVASSATIAALTAAWGLLASLAGPRAAILAAGLLLLLTPLLLPGGAQRVRRRSVAADGIAQ